MTRPVDSQEPRRSAAVQAQGNVPTGGEDVRLVLPNPPAMAGFMDLPVEEITIPGKLQPPPVPRDGPTRPPAANEIARAREALGKLLRAGKIVRVVCVDDEYSKGPPLDQVKALLQVVPVQNRDRIGALKAIPALRQGPLTGIPPDILANQVGAEWESLTRAQQDRIYGQLCTETGQKEEELATQDAVAAWSLRQLVQGQAFLEQSLKQWREGKREITAQAATARILFLIDQDFREEAGREQEGIEIIKDLQAVVPGEHLFCGLLSHTFEPHEEHDKHTEFAAYHHLDSHRFMLISKRRLTTNPAGFVLMLKLAILNPFCQILKDRAGAVIDAAVGAAKERTRSMTVYDLEKIIFESSRHEGVWEPDTLFRVFGMFQRMASREQAKGNDPLEDITQIIREISSASTATLGTEPHRSYLVQQSELYEEADHLNRYHIPVELGDVFRTESGDEYILIAQPCDLMVRSNGSRKETLVAAPVAKIVSAPPKARSIRPLCFELPFYGKQGNTYYVDFRTGRPVYLWVLDMCACNTDGKAACSTQLEAPKRCIPTWKKYYQRLQSMIRDAPQLPPCASLDRHSPTAALAHLFPIVSYTPRVHVEYDCQRVRRLVGPRAYALLTEFTAFESRPAFEHDFEEVEGSDTFDCCSPPSGPDET